MTTSKSPLEGIVADSVIMLTSNTFIGMEASAIDKATSGLFGLI